MSQRRAKVMPVTARKNRPSVSRPNRPLALERGGPRENRPDPVPADPPPGAGEGKEEGGGAPKRTGGQNPGGFSLPRGEPGGAVEAKGGDPPPPHDCEQRQIEDTSQRDSDGH